MLQKSTVLVRRILIRQRQQYGCRITPERIVATTTVVDVPTNHWSRQFRMMLATNEKYNTSNYRSPASSDASSSTVPLSQSSNDNNLPASLIDFTIASKIEGDESHIATIHLQPGETLRAESGAMIYMTEGIVSK